MIANGVDALWLCDTVGANHSVVSANILDVSGNTRHATCFAVEPSPAGNHEHEARATPILSDPGPLVMSGRAGFWIDTINRVNNFAWQGWLYNLGTTAPNALLCRTHHFASTGGNIMGLGAGGSQAVANFRIGGVTYSLQAPAFPDAWNYLVAVYSDDVLQLWVNACLGHQITGVSGDMNLGTSTAFYLGAQQGPNTMVWYSRGLYGAGFGPVLTEAPIIENFEAAGYTQDCGDAEPGFRNYCLSIDEDIN